MIMEYDPNKHCCKYWWKDFCECVKESMKEKKKRSRDTNVNSTLQLLNKNNIEYIESETPNMVIVNPDSDKAFLSLKKRGGLLKLRFKGNNKWYTFSPRKFIERFSRVN